MRNSNIINSQPNVQVFRQVYFDNPRRVLSPGSHFDELTNGSLATLSLAKHYGLVDVISNLPSKVRMQKCLLLWPEVIAWVQKQGHSLFEVTEKLWIPRRTRSKLLGSKFNSSNGVPTVHIVTVANQLNQLQSQQGKLQPGITVQNLVRS